ncbi:MAG: glycosyltransferase family 39 protein, partial [Solirubrobacteraceae bacterium]
MTAVREPPGEIAPAASRQVGRGRGARVAALAAAPALAAALSAYQLTGRSLGFDEGATVAIVSQHGSALWSAIAHDGGNMSGYYLLLHALIGAFGDGLAVLRLPSVVATVATVALVQAIGLRLFGLRAALLAGVLAAVSLPLIYWAQTARAYALMVTFVCAAYLALVVLAQGGGSRRHWLAYVAAMTLAMYCSFVAVLLVPAQLVVLARRHHRDALRRLVTALVAVGVLCVPLAVLAAGRGSGQLFWVPRPTRMVETQVMQSLTSAGLAPSFHHIAITSTTMWATVAAVVAVLGLTIWRARRGEDVWPMALVLCWCALPASLTFLWSFVGQPVFEPRNLIASTPALALVLAPPLAQALDRRRAARAGT